MSQLKESFLTCIFKTNRIFKAGALIFTGRRLEPYDQHPAPVSGYGERGGTSSLFSKDFTITESVSKIRNLIHQYQNK